jgi:ubiquinone/menaquinone biosynthesis C-methylase UbiE
MTPNKTEKELAFLQDLLIATDWGERFAELIDQHVPLPKEGRALYLNAGTGGHAISLQQRAGYELKFLCIDESNERLELARAKALATRAPVAFQQGSLTSLEFETNQFDLALADGTLVAPSRVRLMISELVRVAAPGATVAFSLPTSSSFGEFFSVYWEALHNSGFINQELEVERLITELPTVSQVEEIARCEGLEDVLSWTQIEEFDYDSAEAFTRSPLISDFLMKEWLRSIPEESRERVVQEAARLIDEERHNAEFSLTVKATLVMGRKVDLPVAG